MNEFKFACPNCQQSIQATPEYVGVQISCPSCQAAIVVPDASSATPPPRPGKLTKAPSTVQHAATSPVMATTAVRKKKKPPYGLIIGLGVGAAVIVAAAIFVPKALDKYHQHQEELAAAKKLAENPPPPPDLEADEILKKLGETYKGLASYSAQGESFGNVDLSAIMPALKETQTVTTKLSLRLGRPDHYRMEWEQEAGKMTQKGAVWSAGKGDFLHLGTTTQKAKNRDAALTTAATTLGTLGPWIAALFFDQTNSMTSALKNYAKTNNETLEGQKCYVLTGQIGFQNALIWVRKSDFLIAQAELILGGKVDDSMLAGLTLVQKAQMQKASKLKGNFIETYVDIQTNGILNPGDFEASFPPNSNIQRKKPAEPRADRPVRTKPQ